MNTLRARAWSAITKNVSVDLSKKLIFPGIEVSEALNPRRAHKKSFYCLNLGLKEPVLFNASFILDPEPEPEPEPTARQQSSSEEIDCNK